MSVYSKKKKKRPRKTCNPLTNLGETGMMIELNCLMGYKDNHDRKHND